MESARDEVNTRIDRSRGLHNPVDARMRAANDDHDAFRRIDGQRQLAQFQRARFVRNQRDQGDVGSNLSIPVDELEVSGGPG